MDKDTMADHSAKLIRVTPALMYLTAASNVAFNGSTLASPVGVDVPQLTTIVVWGNSIVFSLLLVLGGRAVARGRRLGLSLTLVTYLMVQAVVGVGLYIDEKPDFSPLANIVGILYILSV